MENRGIFTKRFSALIALLIIFSSILLTSLLIRRGVITTGKAFEDVSPANVKISNITDTSSTISFSTSVKAGGAVNYGKTENLGTIVGDDRDKEINDYYSHIITISGLQPQTTYFFSILSNEKTYLNNGKSFSFTTAPKIQPASNTNSSISGKIILEDGLPAKDTLIHLTTNNSQELAIVTKDDGSYILPLNNLRDSSLTSFITLKEKDIINLEITRENLSSAVKIFYSKENSISPITLSKNYDFSSSQEKESIATPSSILEIPSDTLKTAKEAAILFPKENQELIDKQPQFQGTAAPGSTVKITINSTNTIQTELVVGSNGIWSFRPDTKLETGEHTITIETIDASGIVNRITQNFIVYAEGSQVSQSATPSADLVASKPSPTPTKTIIALAPSLTPTKIPTPTTKTGTGGAITPTTIPTRTPTPTRKPIPTSTLTPTTIPTKAISTVNPTIEEPGNFSSSIIILSISLFLIVAGSILLFVV